MKTVFESRASTILFHLLRTHGGREGVYLLPANVCPVVPLVILTAACSFEFIDIDANTLCMDWTLIRQRFESRRAPPVLGLVYVRTYGYDGEDIQERVADVKMQHPNILVVDDRCLGRPEPDIDKVDWQRADVILYSTGYGKYIDLGHGGFAHLQDSVAYEAVANEYRKEHLDSFTDCYKTHVRTETAIYHEGDEARIAAMLRRYGAWLETRKSGISWQGHRQKIIDRCKVVDLQKQRLNDIYCDAVSASVQLPRQFHAWRFQIAVEEKKPLLMKIFQAGLFASGHFFPASLLFGGRSKEVAEKLHGRIVNLFNDMYFTEDQALRVGEIVRRHVDDYGGGNNGSPGG
jgi:dTDP-4-amino-4,6-dideoxygalactose transaminase